MLIMLVSMSALLLEFQEITKLQQYLLLIQWYQQDHQDQENVALMRPHVIMENAFHVTFYVMVTMTVQISRMRPIASHLVDVNQMSTSVPMENAFRKTGDVTVMKIVKMARMSMIVQHLGQVIPVGQMSMSVLLETSAYPLVTSVMGKLIAKTDQMKLVVPVQQ